MICEKNDVRSRIVFKEYQDRVNMVDYCFENLEEGEQLLNAVIEYAKASGKKYVTVWSGLFTVEHKIFEMYGFKNSSPVTYFGIKDLNEDRYHNYSDWMVQMGDDNAY